MEDSKEDDDLSLNAQIRRYIESRNQFWEEFPRKVVEGLPPVDGKYMPPNIKDAVAWLYANIQEEDIVRIKSLDASYIQYHQFGRLDAYLVAQFRITDNETLMENAAKDLYIHRPVNANLIAFHIVEAFWSSLHKKRPTK